MFGGSLPSKTPQLKADTRDVENPSIFPHLPRPVPNTPRTGRGKGKKRSKWRSNKKQPKLYLGVSKNRGVSPKMDGLLMENPY